MKPRRVGLTVSLLPIAMLLAGCALPIAPPLLPIDRAVTLEPDEGALVVEIESNALVQRLELQPVDGLAVVVTLTNIAPGRNAHLIVLPKGAYRWAEVDLPGIVGPDGRAHPARWLFARQNKHWRFRVHSGVVNYPGLLVLDRVGATRMRMFTLNRSGELLESVGDRGIASDRPIVYSGRGRDDFLEFYASRRARARKVGGGKEPVHDAASAAPPQ